MKRVVFILAQKSPYIWATFDNNLVIKNFQKSPNLVTLLPTRESSHIFFLFCSFFFKKTLGLLWALFLYFYCSIHLKVDINFAHDWNWTADLWCRKRPIYQLRHNHFLIFLLFCRFFVHLTYLYVWQNQADCFTYLKLLLQGSGCDSVGWAVCSSNQIIGIFLKRTSISS